MLKEAIEKILGLATANMLTINDRPYTDKAVIPCQAPRPSHVNVKTLTGFVDLVKAKIEAFQADQCVIHVEEFDTVSLIGKQSDTWGRRQEYVHATPEPVQGFPFGRFLPSEEFVIWLLAGFVADDPTAPVRTDLEEVIKIASNLTSEAILNCEDTGTLQRVTIKKGMALKDNVTIKRRMKLAPYRTFREVSQPVSEFVFRVRQDAEGQVPTCALFEADGGKWKLEAMETVKQWLADKNLGMPVVA